MNAVIINLTQHAASADQRAVGVIDLFDEDRKVLCELLTFSSPPSYKEMKERAVSIANLVRVHLKFDPETGINEFCEFMIGSAPYFMPVLADYLNAVYHCHCVYAFTERVVTEDPQTGVKTSVFKHTGWVVHHSF